MPSVIITVVLKKDKGTAQFLHAQGCRSPPLGVTQSFLLIFPSGGNASEAVLPTS